MRKSYMTTDWAKQRKAIGRIRDEKKLIEILLSDMSHSGLLPGEQNNIRMLCITRISDQEFLAQFYMALKNKDALGGFGISVLKRMTDQNILYALVRQHPNDLAKSMAASHLRNATLLKCVVADASLPSDVRCAAVKQLAELCEKTSGDNECDALFAGVALASETENNLRILCGAQVKDEETLCQIILRYSGEKAMAGLCDKIMKDKSISEFGRLKRIAVANNRCSIEAVKRIDPVDARDVFLQTTIPGVEEEAMQKLAADELLALFDELPKDSPKREHIAAWMPAKSATAAWWRQRAAEYPQRNDVFLERLAWCGGDDDVIAYVKYALYHHNNMYMRNMVCTERCSFALIEALEEMVTQGDAKAAELLRWLYSEAKLQEPFEQHAYKQKKRFRDVHRDGHFGDCLGADGHSDYIAERLIVPL